jgi:hypothetical protein
MTPLAGAPKTAKPTGLPIDRANRFTPVTTPRSFHCTLDWAAMRLGVTAGPKSKPTTKQLRATRATDDVEVVTVSALVPESGELPVEIARNVGTKDVSPIRMAPPPREMTVVVIRSRREKTQRDRTGSGAVLSINTNEVSSRTPRLNAPTLWAESQV